MKASTCIPFLLSLAATTISQTNALDNTTATTVSILEEPTDVCQVNAKCSVEGSSCTNGETETCCGKTFDSFRCDCSGGVYMCMYTEACMRPTCEDDAAIAGIDGGSGGGMPVVVVEDLTATACETGPAADPEKGCTKGEFCVLPSPTTQLDIGVCNNRSGVNTGVCMVIPDMCTMDMVPVCGCDGNDYSNECGAHSNGVSVARMGECNAEAGSTLEDAVPADTVVANDTSAPVEETTVDMVAEPVGAPENATVTEGSNPEEETFESSANGLGGVQMIIAVSVVSSLVSTMLA